MTSAPATGAAAAAAYGLASGHRLPSAPLDDQAFLAVLAACEGDRVLGLLGTASRDGAYPLTETQRDELEARWASWLTHSVRVERVVLAVLDALDGAGIGARVLKGVALAHSVYPDPAQRLFGDVDLLVAPDRLHDAAAAVVTALDGERAEPEVRPGFDDRFGREVLVRAAGVEIDLHRTFVNGAYGVRLDVASLFERGAQVRVGGRDVPVLEPADRLLHAAYGCTLSDWPSRLVAARDLAQVLAHDDPDPRTVVRRAERWRAGAVLAHGIQEAWRVLRLTDRPPLLDWAERFRARATDRLLLAAARGPARGYTSQLTSLLALRGLADRISFARAVAWPSAEYRDARGLGRTGLVGAGARRATRARRAARTGAPDPG